MSDRRTIAAQVEEMQATRPRPESFAADQRRLAALETPVLEVGVPFPQPELVDATGTGTTVAQVADGHPAVVVLYRGSWCPYCNLALRTYQEQVLPELEQRGVRLIAVSPEREDGSMTLTERHALAFPVLSDPADAIAYALGVITRPSEASLETQRSRGLDLRKRNTDGTVDVPMPTVALVDGDGVLVWADVHPDYTTRTEPAQILQAVREHITSSATRTRA